MTKQEFLAMSLPYKLKVYVKYNHKPDNSELETMIGIVDDCIVTDMHEENMAPLSISNYGLCLRPLSDLTKPIEHKGEKFVPIVELASICYNNIFTTRPFFKQQEVLFEDNSFGFIGYEEEERVSLTYVDEFNQNEFEFWISGRKMVIHQFMLFYKLIEWHFDIADLISKGEAIDVNTLPENPYK